MSDNYYNSIMELLNNASAGVSYDDWTIMHSLIASNKQLSTSLLKTHIFGKGLGDPIALMTGDPIRSNLFAYWYRTVSSGAGTLEYRMNALKETHEIIPTDVIDADETGAWDSCTIQKGKVFCPAKFLSRKYKNMGLDISFAPENHFSQGQFDDETAPFGVGHKQSLFFSFDYGVFQNAFAEQVGSEGALAALLALITVGDMESRPVVIFYSLLAALLAPPGEKYVIDGVGNPVEWARWVPPSTHTPLDDSKYTGFFDYGPKIMEMANNATLAQLPAEYPFIWLLNYYGFLLHNKAHYDLTFDAPLPMSEQTSVWNNMVPKSDGQHGAGGGYIRIEPVYNFYVPLYEKGIVNQPAMKEHLLPNIYAFSQYELSTDIINQGIVNNLTLQGKIPENQIQGVLGMNEEPVQGTMNSNQYFDLFGKLVFDVSITDDDALKGAKKFSHIFISPNNLKFIEHVNERKSAFPMHVDIKFDAASPGKFCSILAETNNFFDLIKAFVATWFTHRNQDGDVLMLSELNNVLPGIAETGWKEERLFNFCTEWEIPPGLAAAWQQGSSAGDLASAGNNSFDHTAPMFNINSWWYDKMEDKEVFFHGIPEKPSDFIPPIFAEYGLVLGKWAEASSSNPVSDFANQIKELIYAGKFKKLIKQHFRSYKQMFLGKKAYSETVFYRIQKIGFVNETSGPKLKLQNIWIPNMPGHDEINYIDTQVKYGFKYEYRVFAYKIVIGSKYWYRFYQTLSKNEDTINTTNMQEWLDGASLGTDNSFTVGGAPWVEPWTWDGLYAAGASNPAGPGVFPGTNEVFQPVKDENKGTWHASIDIMSEPDVYLVEVPIYSKEIMMLDKPPMPPDVEIKPYVGVNNKICINLNSQSGDRNMVPEVIETEDSEIMANQRISQSRNLVLYTSEDGKIEYVDPTLNFKFDDHPAAFQVYRIDFKPSSYAGFAGSLRQQIPTEIGSDYVDNLIPNKKYYYTFRTVDIHNNISNPSIIYEIEMVSEGGISFLLCEVVDLETEKEKNRSVIAAKPMRRYIRIFPSDIQLILNKSLFDPNIKSAIDLGLAGDAPVFGAELEESIFYNKDIKVRFTSKSTGRKIDLNLKFVVEHIPTDQKLLNK